MGSLDEVTTTPYRTADIPVAGGRLHTAIWGESGPLVLAIHGITSSHQAWVLVGPIVSATHRMVGVDLRGRGRSRDLPEPYGMAAHAADMAAVIEHAGAPAIVVGHSMGAFVAVELARTYPALVDRLVLVDGGPPLPLLPGLDEDAGEEQIAAAIAATVGPGFARLSMTFPSRADYRDMWRAHPSLQDWSGAFESYVDYDLVGEEPALRPACVLAAALRDARDLYAFAGVEPQPLPVPATFLRAERGMLNEETPFYQPGYASVWFPGIVERTVDGVNHYTITLGPAGAAKVAETVTART